MFAPRILDVRAVDVRETLLPFCDANVDACVKLAVRMMGSCYSMSLHNSQTTFVAG